MIQPSGLPGFRQATTKPTAAKGAVTQTGTEPPWRSGSGAPDGPAAPRRSSMPAPGHRGPLQSPVTPSGSGGRRHRSSLAASPPQNATLRPDRSGNVTAQHGTPTGPEITN